MNVEEYNRKHYEATRAVGDALAGFIAAHFRQLLDELGECETTRELLRAFCVLWQLEEDEEQADTDATFAQIVAGLEKEAG